MALIVKDRVKETTTTTGTGSVTLAGASTGFRSFADIGNANTTYYCISGGSQFEVGIGTYTASGTTLSRNGVFSNSLGTTELIDFSAGDKDVFVTYPSAVSITNTNAVFTTDITVNNLKVGKGIGTNTLTNTAFGSAVLSANTTGISNTAIGADALGNNTTGSDNTALGATTLSANTTGIENTALGSVALSSITTGSDNTGVGYQALALNETGINNTALGSFALNENTGSNNTSLGYNAGVTNLVGSNSVYIGSNATGTGSNEIAIGANAVGTGANSTVIGNSSTTQATIFGAVTARISPRVSTTTSSATPTINTDNTDQFGLTAQAVDITSFTTNLSGTPTNGQKLWIYIVGTAARAITWGASFESSTATLPTTTVTTNRLDIGFVWNAATSKWRCVAVA